MKNVLEQQLKEEQEMFREAQEMRVKEMLANNKRFCEIHWTPEGYSVNVFEQQVALVENQETALMLDTVIRNTLVAAGVICA